MLRIHGRASSSNVQAVMWLVGELGIGHERLDVGGPFGGNQEPGFLAMNPMGRIPVVEDGDVTMFESQAILRYLATRHGGERLWPSDPVARAPVDQWMEWAKVHFQPVLMPKVFWPLMRSAASEGDRALLAEGTGELKGLMPIAEARIAEHGWLAGPEMSLADITFATQLFRYFTLDFERAELPALRGYYDRLCERPTYAEHVMVSYDSLRTPAG